jgi:hypothetical protein
MVQIYVCVYKNTVKLSRKKETEFAQIEGVPVEWRMHEIESWIEDYITIIGEGRVDGGARVRGGRGMRGHSACTHPAPGS